jgi:prenylcysteine oxidase/farnesylcysteine lyase
MAPPRIGIVGAGIAGSTLAYLAGTRLEAGTDVVVFEREPRVGGRIRRVSVDGRSFDAGGKYIHSSNELLLGLADGLGLELSRPNRPTRGASGIWDGSRFVARVDGPNWRAHGELLRRYRVSLPLVRRAARTFLRRFVRVYRPPVSTTGFESPAALLGALDLDGLLRVPGDEYLRRRGVSERAIREYAGAISRNYYAQNASDVHAFACLVALTGGGATGTVYRVDGGTVRLCRRLLRRSGADVRTATAVRSAGVDDGTVTVETSAGAFRFDVLCIAAPLESLDVTFDGSISVPSADGEVVGLETNFVVGEVDPAYFGTGDVPPGSVLTTVDSGEPFCDLHRLTTRTESGRHVFALASRQPSVAVDETGIFRDVAEVQTLEWRAYPAFAPRAKTVPFRLHPNVYYVNAMEPVVSAMETQVIASRNVWNLLVEDGRVRVLDDPAS